MVEKENGSNFLFLFIYLFFMGDAKFFSAKMFFSPSIPFYFPLKCTPYSITN